MPDYGPAVMMLGGIVFALSNSLVEELVFRGLLWSVLEDLFRNRTAVTVILTQGLLFGLWHWKGFPGGFSGVVLVFVWGSALGWLRHRFTGLAVPFVCHVGADLTIFIILYTLLRNNVAA
jgi:membrane protease YdiL (CAAX protease family)